MPAADHGAGLQVAEFAAILSAMPRRLRVLPLILSWLFVACGGPPRGGKTTPNIEDADLPYRILGATGGREISEQTFQQALTRSHAVCIGESHTNPHDHWAQLSIVRWLVRHNASAGKETALGMEMFQQPFQGVLDDFQTGRIDEPTLLARSGWEERWGYDWEFYAPIVRTAVKGGARLLALNISTELKKKVSRQGIENLAPEDRAKLPEVDLDNKAHRAWWDDIMESMGGPADHHGQADTPEDREEARKRADRMYSVQVLWDETMADTAARWLAGGRERQVLILAGNGHCHDSGIVIRLKKRGVRDAVSIRPLVDDKSGELSQSVAAPENDFLFVMSAEK